MATPTELLILRGLHLIIRASFSPNDPTAQAKHFKSLTDDIGPWFKDYADAVAGPQPVTIVLNGADVTRKADNEDPQNQTEPIPGKTVS